MSEGIFISKAWVPVLKQAERVAVCKEPIVIDGETGAGKFMLAEEIHRRSYRRNFFRLSCANVAPELIEGELFGTEQGAFTGAVKKMGVLERMNGGTVVLDELDNWKESTQAKLLRLLDDRRYVRVGGVVEKIADVALIFTTNQNLSDLVARGQFRRDLFYRLDRLTITVPPLRERGDDLIPLIEHFLQKDKLNYGGRTRLTGHDSSAVLQLECHDWPGNVRELRNAVGKALLAAPRDAKYISLEDIAAIVLKRPCEKVVSIRKEITGSIAVAKEDTSIWESLRDVREDEDRRTILEALDASHWNRKMAAKILRMDYKAMLYKMKKLGIGDRSAQGEESQMLKIAGAPGS